MPGFEIIDDAERKEVLDVLETGVLHRYGFDAVRKGHWKAKTFEAEFARRTGAEYCLLVSNGTAALSTALAASGIGAGDEVIIPPFTFVATFEAVIWAGAVPIFAEIDNTLCLDPASVKANLSPRTKAVLPVHMCGSMARIDEIKALCDEKGLVLIEDVAQSVGGTFKGKALGTFGHMGSFSFDPVKTITCGEGGAIITDDETLYRRADYHADHGHDHVANDRGLDDHPILGNNFRISELQAALAASQLRRLPSLIRRRQRLAREYDRRLSGHEEIVLPDAEQNDMTMAWFAYVVRLADRFDVQARDRVRARMSDLGVETGHYFPAVHRLPSADGPGMRVHDSAAHAEALSDRVIALPFFHDLDGDQMDRVCEALISCVGRQRPA